MVCFRCIFVIDHDDKRPPVIVLTHDFRETGASRGDAVEGSTIIPTIENSSCDLAGAIQGVGISNGEGCNTLEFCI